MKFLDIAIVIPTLNEEKYIGILLDSIISQTVQPKEIVIIDAESKDKTIEEIKKRQNPSASSGQVYLPQLKYYQIPKYTIGRQRNFGVTKTKSENILFLDADMKLENKDYLEVFINEFDLKKADFAISTILPLSTKLLDRFLYLILNSVPKIFKPFKYYATTMVVLIKRPMFNLVNGFDQDIKVAEDFEFMSRLQKAGAKFEILSKARIHNSVRRLEKEGRIRWNLFLIVSMVSVIFFGYKKNPIADKYELGRH